MHIREYGELLLEANGYTRGASEIIDFIIATFGDTQKATELLDDYAYYSLGVRDYDQVKELISCEW